MLAGGIGPSNPAGRDRSVSVHEAGSATAFPSAGFKALMVAHVPIAVTDLGVPDLHAVLMIFGRARPVHRMSWANLSVWRARKSPSGVPQVR